MSSLWMLAGGGAMALLAIIGYIAWDRRRPKVFSREKTYSIRKPFALIGAPDLVLQKKGGLLEIQDLKTRTSARVFESDKIQLSLYRLLVERATGRKVSDEGFIRIRGAGGERMMAVRLMGTEELERLHQRYWDVLEGNCPARHAPAKKLCESCGFHQKQCFPPTGRR